MTAPFIILDVAQQLRELLFIGEGRALLLAVRGETFVEVDIGERGMLDQPLALGDRHDLAARPRPREFASAC